MPNRVEELASNAMGKMKAAKATVTGLTGVFKTLTEEHGKVSALLMRVKMSSDADVRRTLFPTIRKELLSHEAGERTVVYPALRAHPETAQMADEHDRDANELEQLIGQLHLLNVEDPAWGPTFTKLVAHVQTHTTEEENKYFQKASKVLRAAAEDLDARYQTARAEALLRIQ